MEDQGREVEGGAPDESGDAFENHSYFSSLDVVCPPVLDPTYCPKDCHAS